MLQERYLVEEIGFRDRLYHPRGSRPPPTSTRPPIDLTPFKFRAVTESNVALATTHLSEAMGVQTGLSVAAFGAEHDTNWFWPLGSNAMHGLAVARLVQETAQAVTVTFRIMADDPERGSLVWQTSATVGVEQPQKDIPFYLFTGNRPLWLQTIVPRGMEGVVFAGWRQLRITHSNEADRSEPPPFSTGLRRIEHSATAEQADELCYAREEHPLGKEGWVRVPSETWRRVASRAGQIRVKLALQRNDPEAGHQVSVKLAWYRAGRFEIMTERLIDPRETSDLTLEANVTEPGGWVGVLTRHGATGDGIRITAWEHLDN